jgi:hypothetical protein
MKTLFRSEKHCLLFGTSCAVGFFLATQAVADAMANPTRQGIDPRLLSVSLTMAYCSIVSLRALFDLPGDRNASWVFRSLLDLNKHEGRQTASKVMIAQLFPWLILPALPLYVMKWNWSVALMHTGYILMCSTALAQLLLLRFRKIPFTCSYTASRDRVLAVIFLGLIGLSVFSGANASFERTLLARPLYFLFVIPVFVGLLSWIRRYWASLPAAERILIFEDRPRPEIQVLNLSK